ncbi:hypothetical protein [Streptosporangium vulgare]|uniref:hypothetical protein n=1 Tax=Streptosporangium vulgare TaxID=46190 RepID=UPI0031E01DEC
MLVNALIETIVRPDDPIAARGGVRPGGDGVPAQVGAGAALGARALAVLGEPGSAG